MSQVATVVDRLLEVLRTPSEAVQRAVANCFPGLVASLPQEDKDALVARLLDAALHGERFADRRGAGFGLAGVVKGMGFSALKGESPPPPPSSGPTRRRESSGCAEPRMNGRSFAARADTRRSPRPCFGCGRRGWNPGRSTARTPR